MRNKRALKKKAIENYIEMELQHYAENTKLLEELKLDIAEEGMGIDYQREKVATSNQVNDTEEKVIKIESSRSILHLERTNRAIEKAIKRLSEIHKSVFELHYIQENSAATTCNKIPCSLSRFYVYKRDIIKSVADNLGIRF